MKYLFKNFKTLFFAFFLTFSLGVISCGDSSSGGDGTKYKVTLTQPLSGGTISAAIDGVATEIPQGGKFFDIGTEITFTFTSSPDYDYLVGSWSGATVSQSDMNVATLTVNGDVTVKTMNLLVQVVTPEGAFTTEEDTGTASNPIISDDVSNYVYCTGVFYGGSDPDNRRNVKLSTYRIDKTEVTYNQWREVYNWAITNGYTFAHAGKAGSVGATATAGQPLPADEDNGSHPVTVVSWRDCVVWCNAYTEKFMGEEHCVYRVDDATGAVIKDARDDNAAQVDAAFAAMDRKGFRLPTEAEWEFAARYERGETDNTDGTAVPYSDGLWLTKLTYASGATANYQDADATGAVAWYKDNSAVNGTRKTHAVGTTPVPRNQLGLLDMSGNAYEWCFDRFGYGDPTEGEGSGVIENPQGTTAGSGSHHVIRGGSWRLNDTTCAVGARFYKSPGDSRNDIGFRLACRP